MLLSLGDLGQREVKLDCVFEDLPSLAFVLGIPVHLWLHISLGMPAMCSEGPQRRTLNTRKYLAEE